MIVPPGAAKCPVCGTQIPKGASECPNCGEPLTAKAFMEAERKEKGSKLLFWAGLALSIVGGGVSIGSYLQYWLGWDILGYNSPEFGPLNRSASLIGIVILVIGIIFLILSLPKLTEERSEDK